MTHLLDIYTPFATAAIGMLVVIGMYILGCLVAEWAKCACVCARRLPICNVLALLAFAAALMPLVAKRGSIQNGNMQIGEYATRQSGNVGGVRSGTATPPVDLNTVPHVSAIDVGPAGVDLMLYRPLVDSASAANVTIAACTDLSARGNWFALAGATFPVGETNVLASLTRATLDAAGITTLAFFSFGGSGDTDGDGLLDWQESLNYGTNPALSDIDEDFLPDGWEVAHGLDPLRGMGDNGSLGDPDNDNLSNLEEFRLGTDPKSADTDEDGIPDRNETGWIETTTSLNLPYVVYGESIYIHHPPSGGTNSGTFPFTLPFSVNLCGRTCSRGYADVHGVVRFVPDDDDPATAYSALGDNQSIPCVALENGISVAAWWDLLHLRANISSICLTDLTRDGHRYAVISYISAYSGDDECQSFSVILCEQTQNQVMVQYNAPHNNVRGLSATLGVQGPNGSARLEHSFNEPVSVGEGISLVYHLGEGSDPLEYDTDCDGMPDGWELLHSMLSHSAEDDNGALGDPDHDGLTNREEYENGSDPHLLDTDGDGITDDVEVAQGSDPADASDGGQPPAADSMRTLNFNIFGDYASWEMKIEGISPEDPRVRRISMGGPSVVTIRPVKLRRGCSYRLSMKWLTCGSYANTPGAPWYCWMAQIDGKPSVQTYMDYTSFPQYGVPSNFPVQMLRTPDLAEVVFGDGWIAENADGLLSAHVHENAASGGNLAGRLSATLHILDIKHVRLWDTYNRCNQVFNPTPKDDFTGNPQTVMEVDQEHGYRYAAPRNKLYVVANPLTSTFDVTEKIDVRPTAVAKYVKCMAFDGTTPIPGSVATLSESGEAAMAINAPSEAVAVNYELRALVDTGDGGASATYANTYPLITHIYECSMRPAIVRGITNAQYTNHNEEVYRMVHFLGDDPPSLALPHSRSLLRLFYYPQQGVDGLAPRFRPDSSQEETVMIDVFSSNCDCFAEWLTHNCGARFSIGGVAMIKKYRWNETSQMSQFLANRTPFVLKERMSDGNGGYFEYQTPTGQRLKTFYDANVKSQAEAVLRNAAVGTEIAMPLDEGWYERDALVAGGVFTSLSSSWVPGITVEVGNGSSGGGWGAVLQDFIVNDGSFDDFDAFGTIGRGRMLDPRYRFTIKRVSHLFGDDTYDVTRVQFKCSVEDLYDFNYEDGGRAVHAAAIQIGQGNGFIPPERSNRGTIFCHRIDISATYDNPFTMENMVLP